MSRVPDDVRNKAFGLCKEFLAGQWKTLSENEFHIEHISGGLSNLLYMCAIKSKSSTENSSTATENSSSPAVPDKVLIRLYGKIIQENPETVVTDSVIFALLAERGMGPKLYGVFTEGRVEEYVPSRHLYTSELAEPAISLECARKMAQFHQLNMPLIKQPVWLFSNLERYLNDSLAFLSSSGHPKAVQQSQIETVTQYDLRHEWQCLKSILSKVSSPVVLCHNDLQEGNILKMSEGKDINLMPIDFEYASYNYRGFDFGNHFCEWCYNYSVDAPPYFKADLNAYPSREQQLAFFRAYLEELGIQAAGGDATVEQEENMLLEASAFALASHFFWAVWAIVQAFKSDIQFDYMAYALVRLDHYFQQKKTLPANVLVNGSA